MKLEKIVLNGFKSFADKTEFDFREPITAIVGPNGCGKSNVVDAIKWVLGNQSPKSLRSDQMTDVIFSGSGTRKPSGMAEVSLHISDVRGLEIEQDDLEIARRLYKSGESEYLINNKTCRLKDIRELFMDTGVGVSAYSIIEQGQIDQVLYSSKVDRRVIFEEAAGISKYKAHKKEALRKLDRTEQNLLRLADIISEVQKQLRSIKLQAGKARNYLEYSGRLKELRVNYSLAEYDKIIIQTKDKKAQLAQLEESFSQVVAEVAKTDASISELGSAIIASESEINRCDNSLMAAKSKIAQQQERIEFLRTRLTELDGRRVTASEQIRLLGAQSSEFTNALAQCRVELDENENIFAEKTAELTELQAEMSRINNQCDSLVADLEDEKSGIIDIVRRTAQLHNEIQSTSTYRTNLTGQKERLSGKAEAAKTQLTQMLSDKAGHQARLDDINKVISELQESLDVKRKEITDIDTRRAEAGEELTAAREERSGLTSEHTILSEMEANREGLSSSLKDILQAQKDCSPGRYDYVEGIVADIITADAEYAEMVEAALEGKTDSLVINDTPGFMNDDALRQELQSRVGIICADRLAAFVDTCDLAQYPQALGRVIEFVNYDGKYAPLAWALLGHTILAESMADAVELSAELGPKYRFVTTSAEVFDGAHSISAGPVGKSSAGLISRKSRLNQLTGLLDDITEKVARIEEQLSHDGRQNEHLTKLCKDLRTSVYEASTEKIDVESKMRFISENIKRLTDEQPILAGEIEMLARDISLSVQSEYDSKQKLTELEAINTERTARIAELGGQVAEKRGQQENCNSALTELKVRIGQIAEQKNSIAQKLTSLQSQLRHTNTAIESTKIELAGCDEQTEQTQRDILGSEAKISELFMEKERAQQDSDRMHSELQEMVERKEKITEVLKEKRAEQSRLEQRMHELQLELSQLAVKDEDLTERVREELQMELAEAYENYQAEDVDWDAVRTEIAELRGKIERIGNVNVDAISEQKRLQERYEFLASQVEDLDKSKGHLEQLIGKINKESKDKFAVTFEEIRKNFQVLFRKLFGGGKADVILEDPNDILDCGIEIIARPPGKEPRSISLLSGGEKTLTALALLFGIFKSKPSPFCFLDEVDAALDETNNERFNMIVQEFKKDSQFIMITHSKRTMSIADVLFGVTMQTQGVSKKISVKFDGADIETEIAVA